MAIKSFFLRSTSVFIAVLALLFYVGVCDHEAWDVEDPQTCRLHFSVVSDIHVEGNNAMRYKVFARSLQDIQKSKSGNDAIFFLGDNTMNGFFGENILFHGAVRTLLRDEKVVTVMGNHDVGNGQGDEQKLREQWLMFTNAFFARQLDKPCYVEQINGYTCIVLGLEVDLQWMQQALDSAADSGKPVLIFAHYPLQRANMQGGSDTDNLSAMLARYGREHDVFSFVGHTHMDLSSSSFRSYNGYKQIYLPRLTELNGPKDNEPSFRTGDSLEVEIYDNELVVRARNFFRGAWVGFDQNDPPYEAHYPLRTTDSQQ